MFEGGWRFSFISEESYGMGLGSSASVEVAALRLFRKLPDNK